MPPRSQAETSSLTRASQRKHALCPCPPAQAGNHLTSSVMSCLASQSPHNHLTITSCGIQHSQYSNSPHHCPWYRLPSNECCCSLLLCHRPRAAAKSCCTSAAAICFRHVLQSRLRLLHECCWCWCCAIVRMLQLKAAAQALL